MNIDIDGFTLIFSDLRISQMPRGSLLRRATSYVARTYWAPRVRLILLILLLIIYVTRRKSIITDF